MQVGDKCFAQGHNGDGSWLAPHKDQTDNCRDTSCDA